jgi:hypothetical protein
MTGFAEFLPPKLQSSAKVLSQLRRSLQPACHDIVVQWDGQLEFQAPSQIYSIFSEDALIVYAFLSMLLSSSPLSSFFGFSSLLSLPLCNQSWFLKLTVHPFVFAGGGFLQAKLTAKMAGSEGIEAIVTVGPHNTVNEPIIHSLAGTLFPPAFFSYFPLSPPRFFLFRLVRNPLSLV